MTLEWSVQSLRLTLFPVTALEPDRFAGLWQALVGEPPEVDEARPRERARRQAGPVQEATALEVQAQPGRIDWLMTPRILAEGEFPPVKIGSIDEVLTTAAGLFEPWLGNVDFEISRMALGAVFLAEVSGRIEGYRALMELVPSLRLNLNEEVSDLLYQINRPKPSTAAPELTTNCVMKWSVSLVKRVHFAVSEQGGHAAPGGPEQSYCRLELDINTKPLDLTATKSLDKGKIVPIFSEFKAIARQKVLQGELA